MRLQSVIPAFVASMAMAMPTPESSDGFTDEMVLFKRDDVLLPRDFELAESHGVNLTEMYRHAILKRNDGDHVTIWVDRDFIEDGDEGESEESIARRQSTRLAGTARFDTDGVSDYCRDNKRQDHTGPNGPTSGGVQAMYRWARGHSGGKFKVVNKDWQNLIVAGSNQGANALYRARRKDGPDTLLGTMDLRNDADWTQNRARSFSGVWRASSKGGETCWNWAQTRLNYELIRTKYDV